MALSSLREFAPLMSLEVNPGLILFSRYKITKGRSGPVVISPRASGS